MSEINIKVSERAANRMKSFLETRGEGIGIRIGVQTSGCSGMAYLIEYVDKKLEDDQMLEFYGVNVFINKKSSIYLNGIEIDYRKDGLNEGFKFVNPNAQAECGCGESFTI